MRVIYVTSGNRFYPHNFLDQFIIAASRKNTFSMEIFPLQIDTDWQQEFFQLVKNFQPEFVFTILGVYFPAEVVQELRARGVLTGIWCVDDPYDLDTSKHLIHWYDYVFTTERQCIKLYRRLGAQKVIYVNFGTEASVYYPELQQAAYWSDLCFVGSPFPKRVELLKQVVQRLPGLRVKVVGPGWEKYLPGKAEVIGRSIEPALARRFYNGAKINLNIHRDSTEHISGVTLNSAGIEATSPNSRTFDIAACRAFQLVDYRQGLKDYFDLADELITFQDTDELIDKIKYYVSAESERVSIATKAYEKTLSKYQLAFSLRQMMAIIEQGIESVGDLQPFLNDSQAKRSEGVLLKGEIKPAVYLVSGGYKHEIPSIEVFDKYHFRWEDVKVVPEHEIEAIPGGNILT